MEGLILERPHGFLLWRGKQTAIGSDKPLPVDMRLVAVCDNEAYGEVVLGAPAAMNAAEFDRMQKEHSIRPEERKLLWGDATVLYMHRIKEWLPYQEMKPVVVENGQVVDRPLPELSEADKELLAQVDKLPKTIVLSVGAVVLADDKAVILDGLDSSKVNGVLSATLGEFNIAGKELPLYQLALVRCPRFIIDKKKVMTEQLTEETMAAKIEEPVDAFQPEEDTKVEMSQSEDDKAKKPDITENSIRVRVINPGKFQEGTFRTIDVGKDTGIQAVVGKLQGESAMTIQTYIFDKEQWSPTEAETWVHDHEGTKADELDSVKAVWSTAFQNNLPDSSFLYIAPGGETDGEGKTKPRTLRYFVYKDASGAIDLPHLRNAIVRIPQSDLSQTLKDRLQKEAQAILEKENKKGEKAGQRVAKNWREKLQGLLDTVKELVSWANYEDQSGDGQSPTDEEMPMEDVMSLFNGKSACGVKTVNGEPWFFTKSTNAFKDRDGEIFSTKSLEQYVAEAEQKADRGYFNFWHIATKEYPDLTDFAKKEWQGVVGRILIEAGPFLPDAKGQAAKKFFTAYPDGHPELAPEGWGCSPEYRYLPEERKTGVYQWIWITRTSTLPRAAAANIWTKGGIMALTQQQKEAADKIFGAELTAQIIKGAESETKQLEEAGVDHKAVSPDPETPPVEAQAEKEFTLDDIVTAVTKRIETDFTPFTEAMAKMAEQVTALTVEVKGLKHEEELKAKAELPRFVLQMKRASQVEETTPKGEELKELKPAEKKPNYEADPAQAFFGK